VGLAILMPLIFMRKGWGYRLLSVFFILLGLRILGAWTLGAYNGAEWGGSALRIEGDYFLQRDPQFHRMIEVASQVRGQTILTGRASVAFFANPGVPAFSDNRSFVGWVNAEESAGHPDAAHERHDKANAFYDGKMDSPLEFLNDYAITAVLVWPDDKMSNEWLDKMKKQLEPEYTYFNCRNDDNPNNGGVFLKRGIHLGR